MQTTASEAAAMLGRIGGKKRTQKKLDASRKNLEKARQATTAEQKREIAKKATEASRKKSASMTQEQRSERARNAVLARWKKAKETAEKDAQKLD